MNEKEYLGIAHNCQLIGGTITRQWHLYGGE